MPIDPGLSAGQAARRLGVAVTTIRTWDRRYGLGPERREQGRHRRYSRRDMQRLELMSRLVTDGVAAAEAARLARSAAEPGRLTQLPPDVTEPAAPSALPQVRGLRRAALTLDDEQLDRILREAVSEDVAAAWTGLICPILRDIGRRHARTGQGVEIERLVSREVSAALTLPRPSAGPTSVLLACAAEELHSLPLEALAASLAARGVRSRMLGARVPVAALEAAMASIAQLRAAVTARPRPALVAAAGPGWASGQLPLGVHAVDDFADALDLIAEVTRASPHADKSIG
jgi:DNA-binding transcriptional MerR regulator